MPEARISDQPTQRRFFGTKIRGSDIDGAAGIERSFSVPFVAELALKEKQIQQNVRPVIAVHKWFARRPGTLFRSLLLSEFAAPPLSEAFFYEGAWKGSPVIH